MTVCMYSAGEWSCYGYEVNLIHSNKPRLNTIAICYRNVFACVEYITLHISAHTLMTAWSYAIL